MTSGGNIGERRLRARGALTLAASVLALAVIAAAGSADRAAAGTCANADSGIDEASAKELSRAVRCLINEERAGRNLRVLSPDQRLEQAAAAHNKVMLKENCWAHQCLGEADLGKRIKRTGYLKGARRWSYGEIFGCDVTPAAMLDSWLATAFSRGQIRKGRYRDVGVAAARDRAPKSGCNGGNEVTYTVVFARRND